MHHGAEQQGYGMFKFDVSDHAPSARHTFLYQQEQRPEDQHSGALQQDAKDENVSLFHPCKHATVLGRVGRPSAFVEQHLPPVDRNGACGSWST